MIHFNHTLQDFMNSFYVLLWGLLFKLTLLFRLTRYTVHFCKKNEGE